MNELKYVFISLALIAFMACSGTEQEQEPIPIEPARVTFSAPITRFLLDNVERYNLNGIFQEEGFIYEKDLYRLSGQLKNVYIYDPENNYKITDLSELLSVLDNLSSLGVEGTGIKTIDLSGKTRLYLVGCTDVKTLTKLNLSGCSSLELIRVYGCPLDSLDLSGCTKLREIELSGSGIRNIDIRSSPNIEKLSISEQADGGAVRVSLTQFQKDRVALDVPENTIWDIEGAEDRISVETGEALDITSVGARIVVKVDYEGYTEWQRGLLLSSEEIPTLGNSSCFVIHSTEDSSSVALDHLVPGMTYYARGFVRYNKDGEDFIRYGNIVSFTLKDFMRENMMSEYVDLGLSVLWAKGDLESSEYRPGLSSYRENTGLYAWGETSFKESFSQDNYTYDKDEIVLDDSDAARVFWGGDWRMPTKDEFQELIDNCDISFSQKDYCYVFVSRINGRSISFSPFKNGACYLAWTSTPSGDKAYAFSMEDRSESACIQAVPRYEGLTVRPVVSLPVNQEVITFQDGTLRQICLENWDRNADGDLSLEEAASVTDIGDVFKGMDIKYFDEFRFFTGVKELPEGSFHECIRLEKVTLPESLERIGSNAFYWCESLDSIHIPPSVKEIGSGAFERCSSLTSCVVPESLDRLNDRVFCDCPVLASFSFPEELVEIGDHAFYGCSNLQKAVFGDKLRKIGTEAFGICSDLEEVSFCHGVEEIGKGAFIASSSLKVVMLPTSISTIGEEAFCASGITTITIPDIEIIPRLLFGNCPSLKKVMMSGSKTAVIDKQAFYLCTELEKIEFPPNLESIREEAFSKCESLKSVNVKSTSLVSVGEHAFSYCTNLKDVEMNAGSKATVRPEAFKGCESLERVRLGDGFGSIGNSVFSGCSALEDISLPESLNALGVSVFRDCLSLKSVRLPDHVKSITSLFVGCSSLSEVHLPDGLEVLGGGNFSDSGISSIEIPGEVTQIVVNAFYGASLLNTVIMRSIYPPEIPPLQLEQWLNQYNRMPLIEDPIQIKVFVPGGCVQRYKTAPGWSYIASSIIENKEPKE